MILLSILISTVLIRKNMLELLLKNIKINKYTEVIVFLDSFQFTIGEKRQKLLEKSKGKFVVFIDDDDKINQDYCNIITNIILENDIDYIGYKIKRILNNKIYPIEFRSIKYEHCWSNEKISYRHISHTNPIKSEIAKKFKFQNINRGEDNDWCEQIFQSKLIKKEFFLDEIMYEQIFNDQTSLSIPSNSFKRSFYSQEHHIEPIFIYPFRREIKFM